MITYFNAKLEQIHEKKERTLAVSEVQDVIKQTALQFPREKLTVRLTLLGSCTHSKMLTDEPETLQLIRYIIQRDLPVQSEVYVVWFPRTYNNFASKRIGR